MESVYQRGQWIYLAALILFGRVFLMINCIFLTRQERDLCQFLPIVGIGDRKILTNTKVHWPT